MIKLLNIKRFSNSLGYLNLDATSRIPRCSTRFGLDVAENKSFKILTYLFCTRKFKQDFVKHEKYFFFIFDMLLWDI